jgi:hypothetical protein
MHWRHSIVVKKRVTPIVARQLWRLQYQFSDFLGRRHVKTIDLPESEAKLWSVGQSGCVLYDSARPADALWIGRE